MIVKKTYFTYLFIIFFYYFTVFLFFFGGGRGWAFFVILLVLFDFVYLAIHQVQFTVVPTKSDSDVLICYQLLTKTLTCIVYTLH